MSEIIDKKNLITQPENFEIKRESLEKLLNRIDYFLNEWKIMEDKWITPEMYAPNKKEELEKIRKNKLRKCWFQGIADVVFGARDYLNETNKKIINKKLTDLIKDIHLTQEREGKMNKELVERGDDLFTEIKNLLEK